MISMVGVTTVVRVVVPICVVMLPFWYIRIARQTCSLLIFEGTESATSARFFERCHVGLVGKVALWPTTKCGSRPGAGPLGLIAMDVVVI